jgi:hypothetical protein
MANNQVDNEPPHVGWHNELDRARAATRQWMEALGWHNELDRARAATRQWMEAHQRACEELALEREKCAELLAALEELARTAESQIGLRLGRASAAIAKAKGER